MDMKGIFISIEGPDGSGKTTQAAMLKNYLSKKGYDIIVTREPGGTGVGERIRQVILDRANKEISPVTEAYLYASARSQLVDQVVIPSLVKGKIVICDRFVDSSLVYQGLARGLGVERVLNINREAVKGVMPDITFLLDLPVRECLKRRARRKLTDRLEAESLEFHKEVIQGYRRIAKMFPDRIVVLDGSKGAEQIHREMVKRVEVLLNEGKGYIR